jgi:hypothetical protein
VESFRTMSESRSGPTAPDDDRYFELIRAAVAVCRSYRPKFGQGQKAGFSLEEFRDLYHQDPFYAWFGLDSPLVYAAHKAAGGITSLYRQVGIACERLFRQLLQDSLSLTPDQVRWSYQVPGAGETPRTLSLDGRIPIESVPDNAQAAKVQAWLTEAARTVRVGADVIPRLKGPVFEVRQGYKSKDSKRQNADIGNASNAYAHSYLPVVVILSSQIDDDVAERYGRAQWLLLRGFLNDNPLTSTYAFTREVLGYDLGGFFQRNSSRIQGEVETVIRALLQ